MAMDYNQTIHLPATQFPMRAGLPKREPALLNGKYEQETYKKIMIRNDGKPAFVLHDGPPYANGDIHIGTALNKILKDIIVRYKNMTGYQAPYVPGWDTHGLPIESAILKNKKIKREELTDVEFRDKCREYALSYVDRQRSEFQRLGVIGDWEDPYITLKPEFEAEQIKVFGKMAEKGYIYKGLKPVYWCYSDETALAEAEIEYQDDPAATIFVKFHVKDDKGKLAALTDLSRTYFVIWTTTAWTLPGNRAICVNPEFEYALMQAPNGEVYIVARELAAEVAKAAKLEDYTILATVMGSELELMTAKHPFLDRESVVLCGDHVTLEAGSGCVHTAPGFGADDFNICQKYDKAGLTSIGTDVPVNAKGVMTDEAFNGIHVSKANDYVIPVLEEKGMLLAREDIVHSYPHCWRCKKPIIYRATEQWFCSVDAIKQAAVDACEDISWHPAWGKERMASMITERSDWCISRQRKWGVPIPIFYCDQCGTDIVTPETIDHVANLFREKGSNVWFEKTADELVPEGFVCPKCGHNHFSKETDIMDVWFDSGSTHAAVLSQRPELHYPADVYLEGGDQYRGWFQSSMLTSIATQGVAPYKQIITHGWTVDGEGRAMHKSLGNAVAPDEVIKDYGADMLRLWVASADYTQDMRISKEILKQLSQAYLKIRNTARYMLGNLDGFDPDRDQVRYEALEPLDKWALSRYNEVVKAARSAFDRYEFHLVYRAIYNFCVVDMSSFYLDIIKDRLYCGDDQTRAAARTALYRILDGMTRLLTPLLAFTSEEIWAAMPHRTSDDASCVLLNDIPNYDAALALDAEELARWNSAIALRTDVNKALEQARAAKTVGKPLDAEVTLYLTPEGRNAMDALGDLDLAALCIVSKVEIADGAGEGLVGENFSGVTVTVKPSEAPKCSRCWTHNVLVDPATELCPRCARVLGKIEI